VLGYDFNGRFAIEYNFTFVIYLIVYFILLCVGILIITKEINKRKILYK